MRTLLTTALLAVASGIAVAHEGHGFSGPPWHASDLVGPLVMAVSGAARWWSRRK